MMDYIFVWIWLTWWAAWLIVGMGARKTVKRESFSERFWHLWPLVAGIGLELINLPAPNPAPLAIGGAIAGLLFAFWARLHLGRNWSALVALKEGHELVRSGPYRFLRHPIYTGLLFAAWSSATSFNTPSAYAGIGLITLAVLIKISHEERFLVGMLGEPYQQMCGEVGSRLIPGVY